MVQNLVKFTLDTRKNCQLSEFLEDIFTFCQENCEGRRLMTRVTAHFSKLSSIYNEIITILYETDPDAMIEEYRLASELGEKAGEFMRIMLGFEKY